MSFCGHHLKGALGQLKLLDLALCCCKCAVFSQHRGLWGWGEGRRVAGKVEWSGGRAAPQGEQPWEGGETRIWHFGTAVAS